MPQIDQIASIYASQLFWLVLVFALIYFVIGRGMLPKIEATVDQRDQRIAGDLRAAEQARAAADAAEAGYNGELDRSRHAAADAAAKAKQEAALLAERRLKAADAEIAERLGHAETALQAARAQAVAQIELVAAEAAQDIVAKVAGTAVDREAASAAVVRAMARA